MNWHARPQAFGSAIRDTPQSVQSVRGAGSGRSDGASSVGGSGVVGGMGLAGMVRGLLSRSPEP
jgi:hypothetical protein